MRLILKAYTGELIADLDLEADGLPGRHGSIEYEGKTYAVVGMTWAIQDGRLLPAGVEAWRISPDVLCPERHAATTHGDPPHPRPPLMSNN